MQDVDIKKIENSKIEISGEIPGDIFENERANVIRFFSEKAEINGFRKGHIPENILIKHIGEETILNEMAERTLQKTYPDIISKNNIDAIGRPEVIITKIAPKNPLGFKIITAVMPNVILPDYKKIAASIKEETTEQATDKEIDSVIKEIQNARSKTKNQNKDEAEKKEGEINNKDVPPELTDEFVKTLGKFENVSDFKQKIRENVTKDKEAKARDKRRMKIAEKIISETNFLLPDVIIDGEVEKMIGKMKDDISHLGLSWTEYLKHIKKEDGDIKKEIRPEAEKRGKLEIIMEKISEKENILPDQGEVKKQIDIILSQYKEAREENVRIYVESVLKNEAVLKFLESQK